MLVWPRTILPKARASDMWERQRTYRWFRTLKLSSVSSWMTDDANIGQRGGWQQGDRAQKHDRMWKSKAGEILLLYTEGESLHSRPVLFWLSLSYVTATGERTPERRVSKQLCFPPGAEVPPGNVRENYPLLRCAPRPRPSASNWAAAFLFPSISVSRFHFCFRRMWPISWNLQGLLKDAAYRQNTHVSSEEQQDACLKTSKWEATDSRPAEEAGSLSSGKRKQSGKTGHPGSDSGMKKFADF